jgi:hypothetical protein
MESDTENSRTDPQSKKQLLANALANLKKSRVTTQDRKSSEEVAPEDASLFGSSDSSEVVSASRTAALKSQKGTFPKYLANAFESESKRARQPSNQQDTADRANTEEDAQLDNVTNLIRAKLKEMKPLT